MVDGMLHSVWGSADQNTLEIMYHFVLIHTHTIKQ